MKKHLEPPENFDQFDLSGFPAKPTNFVEQRLFDEIAFANSPRLKAKAHEKLANYYNQKGDKERAQAEQSKADYWEKQSE
ncbi:hypothetical protein HYY75_10920 [bacterium]|nr:hypothetical protein [bacterium]